jgi:hypothetical protein
MKSSSRPLLALALALLIALAGTAHASQFVATDVSYTHSAETTTDSHYFVSPALGSPADWTRPVDYSKGSAHVLLEVRTKPTDTPTKFQICFDVKPEYACTDQSPAYTAPGVYEWTTPFSGFYQPPGVSGDWSQGVRTISLILKDTNNQKPAGDPDYVPTDLRVEVTILSEGAIYVHPASDPDASASPLDASPLLPDGRALLPDASIAAKADAALLPPDASLDSGEPQLSDSESGMRPQERADATTLPNSARDATISEPSPSDGGAPAVHHSAIASRAAGGLDCALAIRSTGTDGTWVLVALALLAGRRTGARAPRMRNRRG